MANPDPTRGHVLVITDDPDHGNVLRRWVERIGERPVVLVGTESLLIGTGDDDRVDAVVTDLDTGAPTARRVIDRMSAGSLFPGIPKLHVLRHRAERGRIAALDPDAASIAMTRPLDPEPFETRTRLVAEIGRLRRERRRSAIHDESTALPNRRYVLARLEQEFSRSRRYRSPLSLAVIDIDGLRTINHRWDEDVGDRVIKKVADLLVSQCRKEDLVGRIGEDSFAFVLPGTRHRGAAVLAHKLRAEAEAFVLEVDERIVDVRLSAGISGYPDNDSVESAESLLARADTALAEAKKRGGNRVHIDSRLIRRDSRFVLVADRDPELVERAEEFLLMDDYLVVRALTAEAALEAIRFRRPDLVVLDLQMDGPDPGRPLLRAVRDRIGSARCPVIGMSADPSNQPDPAADPDVDRFVTKPFSVSVLRHLARELLDGAPTPTQSAQRDRPR